MGEKGLLIWSEVITRAVSWLIVHVDPILPLVLVLWMAWGDLRHRRIPNYLTFGAALAGLGYQLGNHGWDGLYQGLLGMALGLGLLILFYAKGGMGAGDVKALAALGAWLGPGRTLTLFVYMGLCGGVLILAYLAWQGRLYRTIRQSFSVLMNWLLSRPAGPSPPSVPPDKSQGIPYAVALAAGMVLLCWRAV